MDKDRAATTAMEGGTGITRSSAGDVWTWRMVRGNLVIDKATQKIYTEVTANERVGGSDPPTS